MLSSAERWLDVSALSTFAEYQELKAYRDGQQGVEDARTSDFGKADLLVQGTLDLKAQLVNLSLSMELKKDEENEELAVAVAVFVEDEEDEVEDEEMEDEGELKEGKEGGNVEAALKKEMDARVGVGEVGKWIFEHNAFMERALNFLRCHRMAVQITVVSLVVVSLVAASVYTGMVIGEQCERAAKRFTVNEEKTLIARFFCSGNGGNNLDALKPYEAQDELFRQFKDEEEAFTEHVATMEEKARTGADKARGIFSFLSRLSARGGGGEGRGRRRGGVAGFLGWIGRGFRNTVVENGLFF